MINHLVSVQFTQFEGPASVPVEGSSMDGLHGNTSVLVMTQTHQNHHVIYFLYQYSHLFPEAGELHCPLVAELRSKLQRSSASDRVIDPDLLDVDLQVLFSGGATSNQTPGFSVKNVSQTSTI